MSQARNGKAGYLSISHLFLKGGLTKSAAGKRTLPSGGSWPAAGVACKRTGRSSTAPEPLLLGCRRGGRTRCTGRHREKANLSKSLFLRDLHRRHEVLVFHVSSACDVKVDLLPAGFEVAKSRSQIRKGDGAARQDVPTGVSHLKAYVALLGRRAECSDDGCDKQDGEDGSIRVHCGSAYPRADVCDRPLLARLRKLPTGQKIVGVDTKLPRCALIQPRK